MKNTTFYITIGALSAAILVFFYYKKKKESVTQVADIKSANQTSAIKTPIKVVTQNNAVNQNNNAQQFNLQHNSFYSTDFSTTSGDFYTKFKENGWRPSE